MNQATAERKVHNTLPAHATYTVTSAPSVARLSAAGRPSRGARATCHRARRRGWLGVCSEGVGVYGRCAVINGGCWRCVCIMFLLGGIDPFLSLSPSSPPQLAQDRGYTATRASSGSSTPLLLCIPYFTFRRIVASSYRYSIVSLFRCTIASSSHRLIDSTL